MVVFRMKILFLDNNMKFIKSFDNEILNLKFKSIDEKSVKGWIFKIFKILC